MKYTEFTLLDFLFFIPMLILFFIIAFVIYMRNKEKMGYQFFLPHIIWKMIIGFAFAYIYTYVYGGDTKAYFAGAQTLKNLALENPTAYFDELFSTPNPTNLSHYYNKQTGYPPIWIYQEPNSWFICKIASIFSFISFNSYLCMNLIFTVISTIVTWRFYQFLIATLQFSKKHIAIALLFIPTVGFWCTGLAKDTVVLCALFLLIQVLFTQVVQRKIILSKIIWVCVYSYILLSTRAFVLIAVFIPFFLYFVFHWRRNADLSVKIIIRIFGIGLTVLLFVFYTYYSNIFGEYSPDSIIKTAETTYNDFQNNQGYTGKRYDLGITEFNTSGMAIATPLAIITSIYRPFIWESEGALMLLNGIESTVLLFFTLRVFQRRKQFKQLKFDDNTKNFIFICFIFCLIMAFFVGFTSALFGVLVRMKAPILPFFLLIIFYRSSIGQNQEPSIRE